MGRPRRLFVFGEPGCAIAVGLAVRHDNARGHIAERFGLAREFAACDGVPAAGEVVISDRPGSVRSLSLIWLELVRTDFGPPDDSSSDCQGDGISQHGSVFEVADKLDR